MYIYVCICKQYVYSTSPNLLKLHYFDLNSKQALEEITTEGGESFCRKKFVEKERRRITKFMQKR